MNFEICMLSAGERDEKGGGMVNKRRAGLLAALTIVAGCQPSEAKPLSQASAGEHPPVTTSSGGGNEDVASTGEHVEPGSSELVVTLTLENIFIDGKKLDDEELAAAFERFKAADAHGKVKIVAAANVVHGDVVKVMEMGKAVGLERFSIAPAK